MTQDNYEGTNPNTEVRLDWRHQRVEYIKRLIDDLPEEDQDKLWKHFDDKIALWWRSQ